MSPDTLWDDLGPVTVTLRVDDQPSWTVMRDLLVKHGLSVMDMGRTTDLRIARGSPTMGGRTISPGHSSWWRPASPGRRSPLRPG